MKKTFSFDWLVGAILGSLVGFLILKAILG